MGRREIKDFLTHLAVNERDFICLLPNPFGRDKLKENVRFCAL